MSWMIFCRVDCRFRDTVCWSAINEDVHQIYKLTLKLKGKTYSLCLYICLCVWIYMYILFWDMRKIDNHILKFNFFFLSNRRKALYCLWESFKNIFLLHKAMLRNCRVSFCFQNPFKLYWICDWYWKKLVRLCLYNRKHRGPKCSKRYCMFEDKSLAYKTGSKFL